MYSKRLRILSLLMAFNILASSMGFAVNVHQCKITKAKRYSLWQTPKSCCGDVEKKSSSAKTTLKKASCCLNSTEFQHISTESASFYKVELAKISWINNTFSLTHIINVEVLGNVSAASFTLLPNHSPPIWSKILLIFIQVFRI